MRFFKFNSTPRRLILAAISLVMRDILATENWWNLFLKLLTVP